MDQIQRVVRFGIVNAYLVEEEDGMTLVDTGLPGSSRAILKAAAERGGRIARIVLTHSHGDHIGSLDRLAADLPDAEVSISRREAKLLRKDKTLEPGEPDSKLSGSYPGAKTVPGRLLEPGETVGSLEVHAAPGHTPGHVALLDPRSGTLICGDAYSTLGGVATSAKPNPRFPLPAIATWDRPTALETAKRLRALEPRHLAPGHGRIVDSPVAAMDAAIAAAS
ncbi:MBL fold metallo-hydrolase [Thermoleophilia bacterium SCSIO 60948]|nr:MBL fold metallo-hydrolase [Thermoleophilia bacterium SCSIO 60948]